MALTEELGLDLNNVPELYGTYLHFLNKPAGGIALSAGLKLILDKGTGDVCDYYDAQNSRRVMTIGGGDALRLDAASLDLLGRCLKNPKGLGGQSGQAAVFADQFNTVQDAVDALPSSGGIVLFPPDTYTISSTVSPKSNTHFLGIGHVQLDWDGAADSYMFRNDSATDVVYENLHLVKTGNSYYPLYLRDRWKLFRCIIDNSGGRIYVTGIDHRIEDCQISTTFWLYGNGTVFADCTLNSQMRFRSTCYNILFDHCPQIHQLYFHRYTGDTGKIDLVATGCRFAPSWGSCIAFEYAGGGGAVSYDNVKLVGCTFLPVGSNQAGLLFQNWPNVTVSDVLISGCTFRNAPNAYRIDAGTQNRWRFDNNRYENCTNIYNFSGGTQNSFTYSMDGN